LGEVDNDFKILPINSSFSELFNEFEFNENYSGEFDLHFVQYDFYLDFCIYFYLYVQFKHLI